MTFLIQRARPRVYQGRSDLSMLVMVHLSTSKLPVDIVLPSSTFDRHAYVEAILSIVRSHSKTLKQVKQKVLDEHVQKREGKDTTQHHKMMRQANVESVQYCHWKIADRLGTNPKKRTQRRQKSWRNYHVSDSEKRWCPSNRWCWKKWLAFVCRINTVGIKCSWFKRS